jgi:hypothetical protein
LDLVAPKGCLVNIGFPKLAGGTGGWVDMEQQHTHTLHLY